MNQRPKRRQPAVCEWRSLPSALSEFITFGGKTQSGNHVKPLHWYVACRLVIEGGFRPEEITPRPPFVYTKSKGGYVLHFDPESASGGERTIVGGLKTKNVDVTVTKDRIGPVLAVSCKGMTGALRNLTNRMEEAVGDCTNLHITYPAMSLGYLYLLMAHRDEVSELKDIAAEPTGARAIQRNDLAIRRGGEVVESVKRFHDALRDLSGREGIRDDVSRYESAAFMLVRRDGSSASVLPEFPKLNSPVHFDAFFQRLYQRYDERFVYSAPSMKTITQRLLWSQDSPVIKLNRLDYPVQLLDFDPRTKSEADPDNPAEVDPDFVSVDDNPAHPGK